MPPDNDLAARVMRVEQLLASHGASRPEAAEAGGDPLTARLDAPAFERLRGLGALTGERRGGGWDEADALIARLLLQDLSAATTEVRRAAQHLHGRLEALAEELAATRSRLDE